MQIAKIAQAC